MTWTARIMAVVVGFVAGSIVGYVGPAVAIGAAAAMACGVWLWSRLR